MSVSRCCKQVGRPMEIVDRIRPKGERDLDLHHKCDQHLHFPSMPSIHSVTWHNRSKQCTIDRLSILNRHVRI